MDACAPFDNPKLRKILVDIKKQKEQIIDTVSQDKVTFAGFDGAAKDKARTIVDSFEKFIADNRDELTALQIIYSKPYGSRHLTYDEIRQLADAIEKPPYYLTPQLLWEAYEQLDKSKVRGAGPKKLLTDIISLLRFGIGESDVLEPYSNTVSHKFDTWVVQQEAEGHTFTPEQMEWLLMIKDHIASSVSIEMDDFDSVPFNQRGGAVRVYQLFGDELNSIMGELNEVLAA